MVLETRYTKRCTVSNPDIKDKIDFIFDNKPLFLNLDAENEMLWSAPKLLAINITNNH